VRSLRTRTLSTLAMIGGFVGIIYLGHVPLVLLVLTLQVCVRARTCGRRERRAQLARGTACASSSMARMPGAAHAVVRRPG
jgi:hypothetical protein